MGERADDLPTIGIGQRCEQTLCGADRPEPWRITPGRGISNSLLLEMGSQAFNDGSFFLDLAQDRVHELSHVRRTECLRDRQAEERTRVAQRAVPVLFGRKGLLAQISAYREPAAPRSGG